MGEEKLTADQEKQRDALILLLQEGLPKGEFEVLRLDGFQPKVVRVHHVASGKTILLFCTMNTAQVLAQLAIGCLEVGRYMGKEKLRGQLKQLLGI